MPRHTVSRPTVPGQKMIGLASALAAVAALGVGPASPAGAAQQSKAQRAACAQQWVASWAASPTDNTAGSDPTDGPVPATLTEQTLRMVITPHLGGTTTRIRLSNRFGTAPFRVGRVTLAAQTAGAGTRNPAPVRFGGSTSVSIPAGQDVVSDAVTFGVTAFQPLAVSIYVPSSTAPTKHWNANATSYSTAAGAGDHANATAGAAFTNTTASWLVVGGLDVDARAGAVVAFGDSITDGFVAAGVISIPADPSVNDQNGRYPDKLQQRVSAAGLPLSIVNAGISGNQLTGSLGLMTGPSGLSRFDADALAIPGVRGVLVLEGINDLGLNPFSSPRSIQDAYKELIRKTHAAGKKIWLGTITPASDAIINGVILAPLSDIYRQIINAWIRNQRLSDGVVDFDAALRDPANPSTLNPAYSSPDRLHPNLAGYQRMADTVPLDLLAAAACS